MWLVFKTAETKTPLCSLTLSLRSAPSSPEISPQSSPRPHRPNNDRLSILTKLVKKGEKKGLFVEKMPARIYQVRTVETGRERALSQLLRALNCSCRGPGFSS